MAVWTAEKRKNYPLKYFAGPNRSYPIKDANDVKDAWDLAGHAADPAQVIKNIKRIAKELGLESALPDTAKAKMSLVDFSSSITGEKLYGDGVIKSGKLFEVGDYTDKNFKVTPEDLQQRVKDFEPVDFDIEHIPTIFDGKLGGITSISTDGTNLFGNAVVPEWLNTVVGGKEIPVSLTFDRDTKKIIKAALTVSPRVSDAAIFNAYAEFARHDTRHGQNALQSMHDMAASYGAVCNSKNAEMASKHESSAMQQIHDTTVSHGAKCSSMKSSPYYFNEVDDMDEATAKSFTEGLTAAFTNALKLVGIGKNDETPPGEDPRIKALEAKVEEERNARFSSEADLRITSLINSGKVLPAEKDALVNSYIMFKRDDEANPQTVSFSDTDKKSRVGVFMATLEARQSKGLDRELISADLPGAQILFNTASEDDLAKVKAQAEEWAKSRNGKGGK